MNERAGAALTALREQLGQISFLPGTDYEPEMTTRLAAASRLLEGKLALELGGQTPRLVAFVGGTNVGKSTMFNLFLGEALAGPAETAGATKCAVVLAGPEQHAFVDAPRFLPGYHKEPLSDVARANERHGTPTALISKDSRSRPWVLMDSPDVDSRITENASVGEDVLFAADRVVFVTTDQKYLDRLPLDFFSTAHELDKELTVVFNKIDDEGKGRAIADDFCHKAGVPAESIERIVMPFKKGLAPGDDGGAGALFDPLRAQLDGDTAETLAASKRRTTLGAARFLAKHLEPALDKHTAEQGEIAAIAKRLVEIGDAKRQAFSRFAEQLSREQFHELGIAIKRILEEYRIPIVDDVLTRVSSSISDVFGMFRKSFGGGKEPEPPTEARRKAAFDEALRHVEAAGRELRSYLRSQSEGGPLAGAIYERMTDLEELDRAALQELHRAAASDREAFTSQIEDAIRDWLKDNPHRRIWLQSFKLALRGGVGVLAAFLTGGFNMSDLLIGPLAAVGAELMVKHLAPPNFFARFRERFVELEVAAFDQLLEAGYSEPHKARLPLIEGEPPAQAVRAAIKELSAAL